MTPVDDELLPIGEVAEMLGVDVQTVRNYARDGYLAVVVLPTGHRRFHRSDVERYLQPKEAK